MSPTRTVTFDRAEMPTVSEMYVDMHPLDAAEQAGLDWSELQAAASGAEVKWVRPGNLHLTLKFLGDVNDQDITSVCTATTRTAADVDPFTFDIGRDPNHHVAFGGHGRHYCLGAQLARLELTVLFEEVLARLHDLEPGLGAPPTERRGNFVLGLERLPIRFRPGARAA